MKRKGPKIMGFLPISKMFSRDSFRNDIKK